MGEEHVMSAALQLRIGLSRVMSPEIVEISEESVSVSRDGKDVYVAVGRDDLDAVRWAIKNAVLPGACVFLIHVFPPVTSIPTPVGRVSRSQVTRDQISTYLKEENVKRRNLLQKYIRLCTESKVAVDTVLIESDRTAKAILDLIPVLNITRLVMGAKRPPSRILKKGFRTTEFVRKNVPDYCEVSIISDGKIVVERPQGAAGLELSSPASNGQKSESTRHTERNFFECACFSGKFT